MKIKRFLKSKKGVFIASMLIGTFTVPSLVSDVNAWQGQIEDYKSSLEVMNIQQEDLIYRLDDIEEQYHEVVFLKDNKNTLEKDMVELKENYEAMTLQYAESVDEKVEPLRNQISHLEDDISQRESRLETINTSIADRQAEIARVEAERRAEQERIEAERRAEAQRQQAQQAQAAQAPSGSGRVVYWTVRGNRIHPSRDCPGLRNANPRNIRSGTEAQAGDRTRCQRASW